MRELTYNELEEVNGGVGVLVVLGAIADVITIVTAGVVVYKYLEYKAEQAAQQAAAAQQPMVYGPYPVPPYIDPLTLQYMQYYGLCN